jgi:hypothetical protein
MVEIMYQMVLSTIQTLSLVVGIFYYITIMRNQQKTRELALKAQEQALETRRTGVFMQLFQFLNTEESWRNYIDSLFQTEWEDYDDFWEKYGPVNNPKMYSRINNLWMVYGEIGMLIYDGILDIKDVGRLMGVMPIRQWKKWEPIIVKHREHLGWEDSYLHFEYLGKRMEKYINEGMGLKSELKDMRAQII